MMIPSFETLVAFAKTVEGQELLTLKRAKPFYVSVRAGALKFTPAKSSSTRSARTDRINKVLQHLKESGSFEPSDYKEFSFNASYLLALVRKWQANQS